MTHPDFWRLRRPAPTRIVVLGGGFGGVHAARRLERAFRDRPDVEITLVSRDNHFLVTPLLFELWSDSLQPRTAAQPIRTALRRARFVEAAVESVDIERRLVHARANDETHEIPYDQLVVALGAETNRRLIPGSEHAFTFKSIADAFLLRNHLIGRLERADAEPHEEHRRRLLTFVLVGGGLVGVELMGEMSAFVGEVLRYYPGIRRDEPRFVVLEAGPRILPELDPWLAGQAERVLARRGVEVRAGTPVRAIEPGLVRLDDGRIAADTVVLAAGIAPSAAVAAIPVAKDPRGRIAVDATMRSASHPAVWALGDAASVPGPDGRPYPALAQIAVRQAVVLAENLRAALDRRDARPFVYGTRGILAALGGRQAVGRAFGIPLRGIVAWWGWRAFYLMQMPSWSRRLRMLLDRMAARIFRPDIVRLDLGEARAAGRGAHSTGDAASREAA